MTALRRMTIGTFGGFVAALALGFGSPAAGQSNDPPVDVTAAPPPSPETIGPSQLRDFNLRGTVTRSADQPATTAPAAPRTGEAVPSEAAAPAVRSNARPSGEASRIADSPADRAVREATPGITPGRAPVTPSLPLEVTTDTAPQPDYDSDAQAAPATAQPSSGWSWPWIAALIALIGGGAFIAYSQRGRRRRHDDPGRLAFAGLARELQPGEAVPSPAPRPDPVPPRAQPTPTPAPRPDPVPAAAPKAAPKPPSDGTIVSRGLKPQLNVEFHPDRLLINEQEVMLQFEVVLANVGSAPARDVLVEARLFTASATQDREIGEFFQNPMSDGDRMTSIAPLGRISLKSSVRLPIDQLNRFEAKGRSLFVPLVGFNILYRSGSGDGQASASFLVGRGSEEDEKLAPFRIDIGPGAFRGLSARPHSVGMQTA